MQVDGEVDIRPDGLPDVFDDRDDMLVLAATDRAIIDVRLPRVRDIHIELDRVEPLRDDALRLLHERGGLVDGVQHARLAHFAPSAIVILRRPEGAAVAVAVHADAVAELASQQRVHRHA